MQYKLINLLSTVTALCVFFAIATYAVTTQIILFGLLALLLRELILFGHDLRRTN